MIIGASVCADTHAYWIPPHEIPTRHAVVDARNRTAPIQSIDTNFSLIETLETAFNLTKKMASKNPSKQNGKLTINAHRQFPAFSTNAPPTTGPMIVPTDQAPSTRAKYFGLHLKGTISQKMTWLRVMMPPPPMPWTVRPTSMTEKSLAAAQRIVPRVKKVKDTRRSC
jgi:hypothetical protein